MPRKAKLPCRQSGCPALLDNPGFCDKHRRETFKTQKLTVTEDYKERNRFYQRKAWKNVRALQLQLEPLCRRCRSVGKLTAASVVDHIMAIAEGGPDLDQNNLQSLCSSCHNAKTRRDTNK
ncbi:MAG: HNH endonuclease signature motif containing protein [Methylobacter sp.]